MNLKKIILILLLFMLCGCTATYELNIYDNNIKENLSVIETNKEIFNKQLDSGFSVKELYDSVLLEDQFSKKNYKIKSLENKNQLGFKYESFKLEGVINSYVLNQCYMDPLYSTEGDIITIKTGSNFMCYEYYDTLENIKVVFKTNHEVVSTNSHSTEGNSYIWNFTKDSDKNIEISYYQSKVNKTINIWFIVGCVIFSIIIGMVYYIVVRKNKKSNSI